MCNCKAEAVSHRARTDRNTLTACLALAWCRRKPQWFEVVRSGPDQQLVGRALVNSSSAALIASANWPTARCCAAARAA